MTAFTPEHRKLLNDLSTYASACSVDEAMAIRALLAAHDQTEARRKFYQDYDAFIAERDGLAARVAELEAVAELDDEAFELCKAENVRLAERVKVLERNIQRMRMAESIETVRAIDECAALSAPAKGE